MKTKVQQSHRDFENALILGLIIGVFLIPITNHFFKGVSILFSNLILVFGMPLVCAAGLFFCKILFGKNKNLWQFTKFGLIGVANSAVNLGVFNYFVHVTGITRGLFLALISSVAFLAALINSYIWNTHWTFKENFTNTISEFEGYFIVSFIGLIVYNTAVIMVTAISSYAGNALVLANIAAIIGILLSMVWNFVGYKFIVFKK